MKKWEGSDVKDVSRKVVCCLIICGLFLPMYRALAGPLPDTGQTTCYNNSSAISCPQPGEAFYGQDANYAINPTSYTKLDADGNALPDFATTWAMVKDNVTGLTWENKTSDGSIHDGSKTFTWCDTNPATNKGNQGTCGTETGNAATDTEAFIKALNDERFSGFTDWRMPTVNELTTIVDRRRANPSIDMNWFPNTTSYGYWSSTSDLHASSCEIAWYTEFANGSSSNWRCRYAAQAVRAVRGAKSESLGRLVLNGDGTVTDTSTGLMWQQDRVIGKNWENALSYAEGLALAGYNDWRLPNITELQSIVAYNNPWETYPVSIDVSIFPNTGQSHYWSSTTSMDGSNYAWSIYFVFGVFSDITKTDNRILTRAVRSGQSRSLSNMVIFTPTQAARLEVGSRHDITWDPANLADNVKISLSRTGGKAGTFTELIADDIPNNGIYSWIVTGPESFNCVIRIEPITDNNMGTSQGLFTITTKQASIESNKQGDTGHFILTLSNQYIDGIWPIETTWTSSDPAIATISGNLLTAQKNGYVEISTTYEGKIYKKDLFVYAAVLDASESEPNDTKADADIWQADRFYRGTLPAGDTDYFKFTLSSASLVKLGYLSYSSTADTKFDIYNANDTLMASGTSANGDSLAFSLGLAAGDYYLRLTPAGYADSTNYYVVSRKVISTLSTKPSEPINLKETKSGTINHLSDQTDFTFTLSSPEAAKIDFSPTSSYAKYRITLLDSSQTSIGQVESLNQTPLSMEVFCPVGSYTIRITPVDVVDASSSFTVQLTSSDRQLEKELNDSSASATSFDISKPITGRFSSSADVDFYTFILNTPRYLDLTFSAPGSAKRFSMSLYKESEQYEIDRFEITKGQTTSWSMGLGIGRYYLKVSSTDADTVHAYTISMNNSSQTNLEIESNNTKKFTTPIEKDKPMRGRIYSTSDVDYFGFNLPDEGFITVHFSPSTTTGDYLITLVDDNDGVRETRTSINGAAVDIVESYFERAGNYYIKIEANKTAPDTDVDQYSQYTVSLTSNVAVAVIGLKEIASVFVTGTQNQMTVGNTQTLSAKVGYSNATTATITPQWTSLDPSVASVNNAGLVSAVKVGSTSIVAGYGGLTGKFDVTVGVPQNVVKQHSGNLILVAGGGVAADNTLKDSTQYLSDLVYRRFKDRLFDDENIYYINPMPWHDLNGDGFGESIVDETAPTLAKFGNAITQWAVSQSTDGPLYIYLIDHGGIDSFMLYPGEIVTANQLKTWLDTFQMATGRRVVVVIEACKSGSFTDNLVSTGQDRIVVTSTNDQDAYMQLQGRTSFSQFFVDRLLTGNSLYQAWQNAKNDLVNQGLPYSRMQPQLLEGVSLAASKTMVGGDFAIASLFPVITEASSSRNIAANTTQSFYAKLSSLDGIEAVWAVVVPPDYIPPSAAVDLTAPQVSLPTMDLTDPDRDGRFEGSYGDFMKNGDYRLTFYARNANGNVTVWPSILVAVTGGIDIPKSLTVTRTGTGTGTVTSVPAGITCGMDCTEEYAAVSSVKLSAVADPGSFFSGWTGGGCSGTGSCTVSVYAALQITAQFIPDNRGDLNGDDATDPADAILTMKVLTGIAPAQGTPGSVRTDYTTSGADVNGDNKIGLEETLYILQKAAGAR